MRYRYLVIAIVVVAAVLRLWRIDSVPPGVNRDEASIGYTALSLLKTGNDEYGRRFPLSFESFGDWKLPLYIYAAVPFVALLGPTELAIRLPSALAGIATVALVYFLVLELLKNVSGITYHVSRKIALLAAAFLAVSPWHLHLSRVESESNIAVFLITAGLLAFFKGFLLLTAVLFAATYYTYHGNHLTTTLILLGLVFFYRKTIPKGPIRVVSAAIFLVLTGFILVKTFGVADRTKLAGISIFGDPAVIHEKIEIPRNASPDPTSITTRLRYNRVTFAVQTITANYLKSFSPQFLFFKGGGNHAHNIKGIGNFYLIDGVLLLLGLFALLAKRKTPAAAFLLWWLFIAPVASSITKDAPHTNRLFAVFPLPAILMALGAVQIPRRFAIILCVLYATSVLWYLNLYHVQFPRAEAQHWGYAYKQLVPYLTGELADKTVIMSHPERSPYIYFLLYMNYDPAAYQKEAVRYPPTSDAFVHVAAFGRFRFREIDWNADIAIPNALLVAPPDEIPVQLRSGDFDKTDILLPNGEVQFTAVSSSAPSQ